MEFDAGSFPFKADLAFEVRQKLRRVFKVTQNKKGDVYVTIISGVRRGESSEGSIILEDRISLHVSKNSQDYNTFKKTHSAIDGAVEIAVQLNTAIKSGYGFAHLTSVMFSDLEASVYDVTPTKQEQILVLDEFYPERQTLFCALFVGSIGAAFKLGEVPFGISRIKTALFQIVIVWGTVSLPAIPYSRTFSFSTLAPDEPFLGRRGRARRLQNMQSKTSEDCLKAFLEQVPELINYRNNYLMVRLAESIQQARQLQHGASPEEVTKLESATLEAQKLLGEIKSTTHYLHVTNGPKQIFYIDERGNHIPI